MTRDEVKSIVDEALSVQHVKPDNYQRYVANGPWWLLQSLCEHGWMIYGLWMTADDAFCALFGPDCDKVHSYHARTLSEAVLHAVRDALKEGKDD